uniref:Ig-like domain-containing protein n=1 Tax=Parastrongyloides trichosuri TaxID=131310 RepID=A0A0N4ZKS9_PARTI
MASRQMDGTFGRGTVQNRFVVQRPKVNYNNQQNVIVIDDTNDRKYFGRVNQQNSIESMQNVRRILLNTPKQIPLSSSTLSTSSNYINPNTKKRCRTEYDNDYQSTNNGIYRNYSIKRNIIDNSSRNGINNKPLILRPITRINKPQYQPHKVIQRYVERHPNTVIIRGSNNLIYSNNKYMSKDMDMKEEVYGNKLRRIKKNCRNMIFTNSAMVDEISRVNFQIQTITDEVQMLAKKVQHLERNKLRRYQQLLKREALTNIKIQANYSPNTLLLFNNKSSTKSNTSYDESPCNHDSSFIKNECTEENMYNNDIGDGRQTNYPEQQLSGNGIRFNQAFISVFNGGALNSDLKEIPDLSLIEDFNSEIKRIRFVKFKKQKVIKIDYDNLLQKLVPADRRELTKGLALYESGTQGFYGSYTVGYYQGHTFDGFNVRKIFCAINQCDFGIMIYDKKKDFEGLNKLTMEYEADYAVFLLLIVNSGRIIFFKYPFNPNNIRLGICPYEGWVSRDSFMKFLPEPHIKDNGYFLDINDKAHIMVPFYKVKDQDFFSCGTLIQGHNVPDVKVGFELFVDVETHDKGESLHPINSKFVCETGEELPMYYRFGMIEKSSNFNNEVSVDIIDHSKKYNLYANQIMYIYKRKNIDDAVRQNVDYLRLKKETYTEEPTCIRKLQELQGGKIFPALNNSLSYQYDTNLNINYKFIKKIDADKKMSVKCMSKFDDDTMGHLVYFYSKMVQFSIIRDNVVSGDNSNSINEILFSSSNLKNYGSYRCRIDKKVDDFKDSLISIETITFLPEDNFQFILNNNKAEEKKVGCIFEHDKVGKLKNMHVKSSNEELKVTDFSTNNKDIGNEDKMIYVKKLINDTSIIVTCDYSTNLGTSYKSLQTFIAGLNSTHTEVINNGTIIFNTPNNDQTTPRSNKSGDNDSNLALALGFGFGTVAIVCLMAVIIIILILAKRRRRRRALASSSISSSSALNSTTKRGSTSGTKFNSSSSNITYKGKKRTQLRAKDSNSYTNQNNKTYLSASRIPKTTKKSVSKSSATGQKTKSNTTGKSSSKKKVADYLDIPNVDNLPNVDSTLTTIGNVKFKKLKLIKIDYDRYLQNLVPSGYQNDAGGLVIGGVQEHKYKISYIVGYLEGYTFDGIEERNIWCTLQQCDLGIIVLDKLNYNQLNSLTTEHEVDFGIHFLINAESKKIIFHEHPYHPTGIHIALCPYEKWLNKNNIIKYIPESYILNNGYFESTNGKAHIIIPLYKRDNSAFFSCGTLKQPGISDIKIGFKLKEISYQLQDGGKLDPKMDKENWKCDIGNDPFSLYHFGLVEKTSNFENNISLNVLDISTNSYKIYADQIMYIYRRSEIDNAIRQQSPIQRLGMNASHSEAPLCIKKFEKIENVQIFPAINSSLSFELNNQLQIYYKLISTNDVNKNMNVKCLSKIDGDTNNNLNNFYNKMVQFSVIDNNMKSVSEILFTKDNLKSFGTYKCIIGKKANDFKENYVKIEEVAFIPDNGFIFKFKDIIMNKTKVGCILEYKNVGKLNNLIIKSTNKNLETSDFTSTNKDIENDNKNVYVKKLTNDSDVTAKCIYATRLKTTFSTEQKYASDSIVTIVETITIEAPNNSSSNGANINSSNGNGNNHISSTNNNNNNFNSSSTENTLPTTTENSPGSKKDNIGIILGFGLGTIAIVCLMTVIIVFLILRKKRRKRKRALSRSSLSSIAPLNSTTKKSSISGSSTKNSKSASTSNSSSSNTSQGGKRGKSLKAKDSNSVGSKNNKTFLSRSRFSKTANGSVSKTSVSKSSATKQKSNITKRSSLSKPTVKNSTSSSNRYSSS